MSVNNFNKDIIQNLKDAGCNNDTIITFVSLSENRKFKEELNLLSKHRSFLLDKLHKIQKNISCLDYLVYNLNKKSE